jgi:hypothetical protein
MLVNLEIEVLWWITRGTLVSPFYVTMWEVVG